MQFRRVACASLFVAAQDATGIRGRLHDDDGRLAGCDAKTQSFHLANGCLASPMGITYPRDMGDECHGNLHL